MTHELALASDVTPATPAATPATRTAHARTPSTARVGAAPDGCLFHVRR